MNHSSSVRRAAVVAAVGMVMAATLVPSSAAAFDVVKIVVPFAAGGPADRIARIVAPGLAAEIGKSVIVENRGGAGGTVGTAFAAKAPADGSTLLLTTSSLVLSAGTTPNLSYDPRKDVEPIYLLGEVQTMIAVRPGLGVQSVKELAQKARGKDRLTYGSTGVGGTMHLGAELFVRSADVTVTHVPYKGAAPAIIDLIAGTIDFVNADVPVLRPQILDKRLQGLVIFDTRRSPLLPDVPTAAEAGMPDLQLTNWYGVLAPAGVPKAQRDAYAAALARVVNSPSIAATLAEAGFSNPQDTAAFGKRLNADFDRWLPWLKAANIRTE